MYETRSSGEKITGSQIKAVALEKASLAGVSEFSGSNGWLCSFFKRHDIVLSDFNKGNDSTIQLIKLKRLFEPVEIDEQDEENENNESTANISMIECYEDLEKSEMIVQEDPEEIEEFIEEEIPIYSAEWKNWCRLCAQSDVLPHFNSNHGNVIQALFNFQPDENTRLCANCCSFLKETSHFINIGKTSERMFVELDEYENQNTLNDEMALKIRFEYGLDDNEITHTFDVEKLEDEEVIEEEEEEVLIESEIENDQFIQVQNDEEEQIEEIYFDEEIADNDITGVEIFEENVREEEEKLESVKFEDYDFTCHICQMSFQQMFFLTNHTREHHACLPQVACITCGKYLATWDSILGHRRKHSTEPADYKCSLCNAEFVTKTGLAIHNKLKHEGKHGKYESVSAICEVCHKEFKDAQTLKSHSRVHLPDDEKFPFQCHLCEKRLANKYSLKHHIDSVHNQNKTIACHLCGKFVSNRSNLRSHLISHTTENVQCPICKMTFKNQVSLQSHKKLHKENSKNFSCPECGKLFFNRNHLERHRISHSDQRNYKCSFESCEMSYKWVIINEII